MGMMGRMKKATEPSSALRNTEGIQDVEKYRADSAEGVGNKDGEDGKDGEGHGGTEGTEEHRGNTGCRKNTAQITQRE